MLSFVVAKAKPGQGLPALCDRIHQLTGLQAYTPKTGTRGGISQAKRRLVSLWSSVRLDKAHRRAPRVLHFGNPGF